MVSRISSINSINVDVQQGGKVLFVKQTTPLTIVSQNPTLENKALEPIVKGGMPFLVANVAVFFPLKIKSQFFFVSKAGLHASTSSTDLLWNGKKSKAGPVK